MDDRDLCVIIALAECNMKVSDASRILGVHRNTVTYHLEKIKRITGLDPLSFYDLVKLLGIDPEEKEVKGCRNCCHWIERSINGVKVRNGFCCKCHIISDDDHYCKYWERGGQDGRRV